MAFEMVTDESAGTGDERLHRAAERVTGESIGVHSRAGYVIPRPWRVFPIGWNARGTIVVPPDEGTGHFPCR